MFIGIDAFAKCSSFLLEKKFKRVLLVADQNTYVEAGEKLGQALRELNFEYSVCIVEPNKIGDVVADEVSIVQALLKIDNNIDALLAIGSGTIHDITRFCSAKTGKPFISIPTAASVDGFTSLGAPLIVRGVKKTFQTVSPIALFADINVLMNAPKEMTAAGFGDMLAKYTSLADWNFGRFIADEPFCPLAASLTKEALENCVDKVDKIAVGDEEGVRILLASLIQSGLAMLLFGQSHPASGGEHHLSHYWEMEFLQKKRHQVLHGAKVGVSSVLLANLYHAWFASGELLPIALNDRSEKIAEIIATIPKSEQIAALLKRVGGPTFPKELNIDEELVERSLKEAHLLRERFTMLKCYNIKLSQ
ncbi:sn-glycerol-1-phosphate dehydrogenase [Bacillus sp. FJAT-49732]|uniref:Sn-glycerol-1-phosphate dehydrogenase n=2 Tax=Lederbergia citrisecunda TaxID=2833583 RepID=A0A942TLI3_9BACI|nr:sn-glycerol-1-phosphate dehydrogenase [Lederbergia citrisecunda]